MQLVPISIFANVRQLERSLSQVEREQIPFAQAQAATKLARAALIAVKDAMRKDFDRPTPYTLRAFYVKPAFKRDPSAEIRAREFAGKGTPGWKYLAPEAFGGSRRQKRFERALEAALGTSDFTVPGRGAKLNAYGNISQGNVEQILSALGAAETKGGYRANRTARSAKRNKRRQDTYFIGHSKRDGRTAIYRVVSSGRVEPVLVFTAHPPSYTPRLPYVETVQRSVAANAPRVLREEVTKAVATSR